ncbi:hypothetical protein SFRURICE_009829 [Spodoptera frugiperda]|nr:hypothetical protein SFRURICE_009829 [Spodoptera frugiperda]
MYWRHKTESFWCKHSDQEARESEYCYCEKDIPDSPMIGCDGPNCHLLPIDVTNNDYSEAPTQDALYNVDTTSILASWHGEFSMQKLQNEALATCSALVHVMPVHNENSYDDAQTERESEYCSCSR